VLSLFGNRPEGLFCLRSISADRQLDIAVQLSVHAADGTQLSSAGRVCDMTLMPRLLVRAPSLSVKLRPDAHLCSTARLSRSSQGATFHQLKTKVMQRLPGGGGGGGGGKRHDHHDTDVPQDPNALQSPSQRPGGEFAASWLGLGFALDVGQGQNEG